VIRKGANMPEFAISDTHALIVDIPSIAPMKTDLPTKLECLFEEERRCRSAGVQDWELQSWRAEEDELFVEVRRFGGGGVDLMEGSRARSENCLLQRALSENCLLQR
jgi:hypothetical protein